MGIAERKVREFQRREEGILQAALVLAGSEDWQAITIDHIAEKAEIGKGTVYKHFKSKDEVCARLVMDHVKGLLDKLRALDPQESLVPRLKKVLKTIWHHHQEASAMLTLTHYCEATETALILSEPFAVEFRAVRGDIVAFVKGLVEEGIALGIFPPQPVEYLMSAGWASLTGALRLAKAGTIPGLVVDAPYQDYLADFIVKGLMNAQTTPPTLA